MAIKTAITGILEAGDAALIVLRGPYEDIIPRAAQIGYDAVELHIHDPAATDADLVRNLLAESGITLTAIGTGSAYGQEGLSLSSVDEAKRQGAIQRMKDHIVFGSEYNAAIIIGVVKGKVAECPSLEVYKENLSKSLHELVEFAKDYHSVLALEVMNRFDSPSFLNTVAEGIEFLKDFDTDYLKLHLDTFHMNIEERSMAGTIREAGPLIGHFHISDNNRWYAGYGHIDFKEVIDALKEIGYDRPLSVETYQYPEQNLSAQYSLETMLAADRDC